MVSFPELIVIYGSTALFMFLPDNTIQAVLVPLQEQPIFAV